MPAAVAVPAIMGVASMGMSAIQASNARKREKEAQKAINEYDRQDLANPYENLQVSTLGADRQREDLARAIATNANYAAMGGMRGIMGLSPQMIAQQSAQEAQIAASLDEAEKQRQMAIAGGAGQVQQMQENREQNDLLGLGNAYQTARAERQNAIDNLLKTGVSAAILTASGAFSKTANTTNDATKTQGNWGLSNTNGGRGIFGQGILNRNSGEGIFGNKVPQAISNNGYSSQLIAPQTSAFYQPPGAAFIPYATPQIKY